MSAQTAMSAVVILAAVMMLASCQKAKDALSKVDKIDVSVQHCTPRLPATGERHKVPDPSRPSFCTGPILWCSYCEYSSDGALISSGSHPCGVCAGAETK